MERLLISRRLLDWQFYHIYQFLMVFHNLRIVFKPNLFRQVVTRLVLQPAVPEEVGAIRQIIQNGKTNLLQLDANIMVESGRHVAVDEAGI